MRWLSFRSVLGAAVVVLFSCSAEIDRPQQLTPQSSNAASRALGVAREIGAPLSELTPIFRGDGGFKLRASDVASRGWRDDLTHSGEEIGAKLGLTADAPFEVMHGRATSSRLTIDRIAASGTRIDVEQGRAVYLDAWPGADVVTAMTASRFEELVLVRDSAAPREYAWHIRLPSTLTARFSAGELSFVDARGEMVMHVPPPVAIDAAGVRVPLSFDWHPAGDGGEMSVRINAEQVTYPVLVDPAIETAVWTMATPATKPGGRRKHAMAYDSARGRTVLFGGWNENTDIDLGDTWEWDGINWIKPTTSISPGKRYMHPLAYDSARGKTVLFAGYQAGSGGIGAGPLNDTWEWDGKVWTNRTPTTITATNNPYLSIRHVLAYDSARRKTVMHGGYRDEVWEWDGVDWKNVTKTPRLPWRWFQGATYDAARGQVLVFGGVDSVSFNDLWGWNGTVWTNLTPTTTSPAPRGANHHFVYDSARRRSVLFGGSTSSAQNDTWEWDGTAWREMTPTTSPTARYDHAMAYDSRRGRVVMFAGFPGLINDTWEYYVYRGCSVSTDCDSTESCVAGTCLTSNGATCASALECSSGFCADGVCCDNACAGACEACTAAKKGSGIDGVCAAVAAGTDPRDRCTADPGYLTNCKADGMCDGAGACRAFVAAGTSCGATTCSAGTVTRKSCNGAGSCDGFATACTPYACASDMTSCATSCASDANCAATSYCLSSVCTPKKANGLAATDARECVSGIVADGVCCNAACGGTCESCDAAGTIGTCVAIAGAARHGTCPAATGGDPCNAKSCDGVQRTVCAAVPGSEVSCRAPTCKDGELTLAASCNGSGACPAAITMSCAPFGCASPSSCTTSCMADADCGPSAYCGGTTCVEKKKNGEVATDARECTSGITADGLCCDSACAGVCEACDAAATKGTCTAVTGVAKHGACPASVAGEPCSEASCNGKDRTTCAYPSVATTCRPQACSAGVETAAANCNGEGACPAAVTKSCAPYACGDNACKTSCAADTDCTPGNVCDLALKNCAPSKPAEEPAAASTEDSGGCTTSSRGGQTPSTAVLLLVAAAALRHRRARKNVGTSR